jgi:hypothetical protein
VMSFKIVLSVFLFVFVQIFKQHNKNRVGVATRCFFSLLSSSFKEKREKMWVLKNILVFLSFFDSSLVF